MARAGLAVSLGVTGVVVQIFGRTKLQRIHENGDDDPVGLGTGPIDERHVPCMEKSHGGHEPHTKTLGPPAEDPGLNSRRIRRCLHETYPRVRQYNLAIFRRP